MCGSSSEVPPRTQTSTLSHHRKYANRLATFPLTWFRPANALSSPRPGRNFLMQCRTSDRFDREQQQATAGLAQFSCHVHERQREQSKQVPWVCVLSWPALTLQCRYTAQTRPAEGRNLASGSVEVTRERGAGSRIALKWLAVARPRGAQEKLLFASYRQCSTELCRTA